jgi:hypothetical protein
MSIFISKSGRVPHIPSIDSAITVISGLVSQIAKLDGIMKKLLVFLLSLTVFTAIAVSPLYSQVVQTTANLGATNIFTALNTFNAGLASSGITLTGLSGTTCIEQINGVLTSTGLSCGGGNVTGPNSSTPNDIAAFNNTSGTLLLDTGILYTSVVTLTGTQTVSNKTFIAPILGVATATSLATSGLTLTSFSTGCLTNTSGVVASTGASCGYTLPTQYTKLRCETGLGDGLNAMAAGTYLESFCYNDSGVTWTITGIKCYVDGGSSSTLNASGHTLGSLLTGAITCGTGFVAGTQTANVALTSGDYIAFTFIADGTAKQSTWVISMTQ